MFIIKFSIGYNHDLRLLNLLKPASKYLESFYFPIPNKYMGSGRSLPQSKTYPNEIKKIIKVCKQAKVKSLLLLNSTTEKELNIKKIIDYVKTLKGLDGVVVTNPIYISHLKNLGLEIHSSVNCYTKTLEQAIDLKEQGVDVLTLDRDINRDLKLIKEIKSKTKLKIKLLANEGCLRNCMFRKTHFNLIANQVDTREFDKQSCITLIRKHPEKFFQIPFIRPEDLKYYKMVDTFKLATRTMDTAKIALMLDAYINKKFDGDLLFLLSGKGIFEYFEEVDNRVLTKTNFFKKITGKNSDNYARKLLKQATICP